MTVNLPKLNQTGKNEWADVESNDVALKEAVETLQTEVKAIAGLTYYTPKIIATEESRTNTAYGTLTTADEIKSVVLPENGLLLVGYKALWKQSVSTAGRAQIFLGSNMVKPATNIGAPVEVGAAMQGTDFNHLVSYANGLFAQEGGTAPTGNATDVTTGQYLAAPPPDGVTNSYLGGFAVIFAAAGTYDVSVKYKSSSGSVTAKERKLWVIALG